MSAEITTKTKLLLAATRLLDEGGPVAVTLRGVGHAAGVSHNAPYKHFRDKHALLVAVARESFHMMASEFRALTDGKRPPMEALQEVVERYVAFSEAFPQRYNLLFSDPDIGAEEGDLKDAATGTFDVVAQLMTAAQQAGDVRAGDPRHLTSLLYAAIHGLVNLRMTGRATPNKGMEDIRGLGVLQLQMMRRTG